MGALVYLLAAQWVCSTLAARVGLVAGPSEGRLQSHGNSCDKWLVVEVKGSAQLARTEASFYHAKWGREELFVKEGPDGCNATFLADCHSQSIVVEKSCGPGGRELLAGLPGAKHLPSWLTSPPSVEKRCIDGIGCLHKEQQTAVWPGERILLKVPGTGQVVLHSGVLKYYAVSPHVPSMWAPAKDEVEKVAGWARSIAGGGMFGEVQALKLRAAPSRAPRVLLEAAEAASREADGVDAEAQTLNHLLMLLFTERSSLHVFKSYRGIRKLAEDFETVESLKAAAAAGELADGAGPLPEGAGRGLAALAAYFRGFAARAAAGDRRRALIFTCSFGGGHKSAANAVRSYLQSGGFAADAVDTTYDPEFEDRMVLMGAKLFNDIIIKGQYYSVHNTMDKLQQFMGPLQKRCPSPECDSQRKHQFRLAVLKRRPDLLVTVYHMELLTVLEVAKELGNLAVIHMATDMDIKMAEIFTPQMYPVYPRFRLGVPFDIKSSYDTIAPLSKDMTFLSGYPVRSEFLEPANAAQVAAEKAKLVPAGTRVLLVMTGGGGQDIPWPYRLAETGIGQPLHIVIVAGGNNELADRLRAKLPGSVAFPDGRTVWQGADKTVTVEVAMDPDNTRKDKPFFVLGRRLAFLMDAADVILSKPGGGSTAEIAYRGTPAIFDGAGRLFHWEQFTVDIFEEERRGLTFQSKKSFRPALLQALELGRSTRLAEGPGGVVLNTSVNVLASAERVLAAQCARCKLFSDDKDP